MKNTLSFLSNSLLICPALLLAGCAAQFQKPQLQSDPNSTALAGDIHTTTAELNRVERQAYDKGFVDGQAYERLNPSAQPTTILLPCPVSISCPAQVAPIEQPSSQSQTTQQKTLKRKKPSLDYSTSGPAQPLSP